MKHPHFTLLYTEANESMKLGGGSPPPAPCPSEGVLLLSPEIPGGLPLIRATVRIWSLLKGHLARLHRCASVCIHRCCASAVRGSPSSGWRPEAPLLISRLPWR